MKTKSLLTILIITIALIMVLCSFSYGLITDAQDSIVLEQGFSIFGKAGSFNMKERSFVLTDQDRSYSVCIPIDHKIIIDGKLGSFESIDLIADYKDITVSAPGNNNKIIYIQTIPKVFSGTIRKIENTDDFLYISIESDFLSMVFYIEKDSFPDNIHTGDHIRFIPDGSKIIEVVKE